MMFAKRLIQPELLDHAPPGVASKNLADLVRINKRFGGHSTIRQLAIATIGKRRKFSLLDVGAASGDTAALIKTLYPEATVTNLDYSAVNLQSASHPKLVADAFHLPFLPESFDFVLSSLFLHHFEDRQVETLLKGMYRVARRSILVADLERHILPYLFLPASRALFRWGDITVHDGIRSVRAAFTAAELTALAQNAGLCNPIIARHRPAFRLTLQAAKS